MPSVFAGSQTYPEQSVRPVLTIGNFDGLHRGHRHLIRALTEAAHAVHAPAVVYTFDPPPRVVLAPDRRAPRIQTWADKVAIMGELGVDHVVVETFTREFAAHPPEWFLDVVVGQRIRPQAMVVGYDFRFGRGRSGDVDTLRAAFPEIPVTQVSPLQLDGQTVSSSRIRQLVTAGDVAEAGALLGCPHRIRGQVIPGDARGRTIGFPTANLQTSSELIPARGVYAVRARWEDGPWHSGVANLGTRPTFDGQGFLIEVHLLNFEGNLYGQTLEVDFVDRLRGELPFESADQLVAQIQSDVAVAQRVLSE